MLGLSKEEADAGIYEDIEDAGSPGSNSVASRSSPIKAVAYGSKSNKESPKGNERSMKGKHDKSGAITSRHDIGDSDAYEYDRDNFEDDDHENVNVNVNKGLKQEEGLAANWEPAQRSKQLELLKRKRKDQISKKNAVLVATGSTAGVALAPAGAGAGTGTGGAGATAQQHTTAKSLQLSPSELELFGIKAGDVLSPIAVPVPTISDYQSKTTAASAATANNKARGSKSGPGAQKPEKNSSAAAAAAAGARARNTTAPKAQVQPAAAGAASQKKKKDVVEVQAQAQARKPPKSKKVPPSQNPSPAASASAEPVRDVAAASNVIRNSAAAAAAASDSLTRNDVPVPGAARVNVPVLNLTSVLSPPAVVATGGAVMEQTGDAYGAAVIAEDLQAPFNNAAGDTHEAKSKPKKGGGGGGSAPPQSGSDSESASALGLESRTARSGGRSNHPKRGGRSPSYSEPPKTDRGAPRSRGKKALQRSRANQESGSGHSHNRSRSPSPSLMKSTSREIPVLPSNEDHSHFSRREIPHTTVHHSVVAPAGQQLHGTTYVNASQVKSHGIDTGRRFTDGGGNGGDSYRNGGPGAQKASRAIRSKVSTAAAAVPGQSKYHYYQVLDQSNAGNKPAFAINGPGGNYDEKSGLFSSYETEAIRQSRKETYLIANLEKKLKDLEERERVKELVEMRAQAERERLQAQDKKRQLLILQRQQEVYLQQQQLSLIQQQQYQQQQLDDDGFDHEYDDDQGTYDRYVRPARDANPRHQARAHDRDRDRDRDYDYEYESDDVDYNAPEHAAHVSDREFQQQQRQQRRQAEKLSKQARVQEKRRWARERRELMLLEREKAKQEEAAANARAKILKQEEENLIYLQQKAAVGAADSHVKLLHFKKTHIVPPDRAPRSHFTPERERDAEHPPANRRRSNEGGGKMHAEASSSPARRSNAGHTGKFPSGLLAGEKASNRNRKHADDYNAYEQSHEQGQQYDQYDQYDQYAAPYDADYTSLSGEEVEYVEAGDRREDEGRNQSQNRARVQEQDQYHIGGPTGALDDLSAIEEHVVSVLLPEHSESSDMEHIPILGNNMIDAAAAAARGVHAGMGASPNRFQPQKPNQGNPRAHNQEQSPGWKNGRKHANVGEPMSSGPAYVVGVAEVAGEEEEERDQNEYEQEYEGRGRVGGVAAAAARSEPASGSPHARSPGEPLRHFLQQQQQQQQDQQQQQSLHAPRQPAGSKPSSLSGGRKGKAAVNHHTRIDSSQGKGTSSSLSPPNRVTAHSNEGKSGTVSQKSKPQPANPARPTHVAGPPTKGPHKQQHQQRQDNGHNPRSGATSEREREKKSNNSVSHSHSRSPHDGRHHPSAGVHHYQPQQQFQQQFHQQGQGQGVYSSHDSGSFYGQDFHRNSYNHDGVVFDRGQGASTVAIGINEDGSIVISNNSKDDPANHGRIAGAAAGYGPDNSAIGGMSFDPENGSQFGLIGEGENMTAYNSLLDYFIPEVVTSSNENGKHELGPMDEKPDAVLNGPLNAVLQGGYNYKAAGDVASISGGGGGGALPLLGMLGGFANQQSEIELGYSVQVSDWGGPDDEDGIDNDDGGGGGGGVMLTTPLSPVQDNLDSPAIPILAGSPLASGHAAGAARAFDRDESLGVSSDAYESGQFLD